MRKTISLTSMNWRRMVLLGGLPVAALLFGGGLGVAQEPTREQTIAAGRRVFSGSCGMAYCHGNDAVGGGGPKLRGREYTAEALTRIVTDGIPGTGMPAFKGSLKKEQIGQVVAFLLSVNKEIKSDKPAVRVDPHFGGETPAKPKEEKYTPPAAAATTTKPAASAAGLPDLASDWTAGERLFFDLESAQSCRVCHTAQGRGGKVASDLGRLSDLAPRDLLRRLLAPHASLDGKHAMMTLTLKSGERITGILRDEEGGDLRIYDTSSLPPISRNFANAEIARREPLPISGCPGNYASKYTLKQLLDLIAFLKTADPAKPAVVRLQEIF